MGRIEELPSRDIQKTMVCRHVASGSARDLYVEFSCEAVYFKHAKGVSACKYETQVVHRWLHERTSAYEVLFSIHQYQAPSRCTADGGIQGRGAERTYV